MADKAEKSLKEFKPILYHLQKPQANIFFCIPEVGIVSEMVTERVFLKVYVDAILAIQARARAKTGNRKLILPLAIMTSNDTHVAIEELLKTNKNFGAADGQIILMKQQKVPALADGKGTIAVDGASVVSKPHGHGDVHSLLYQTGLASKFLQSWLRSF